MYMENPDQDNITHNSGHNSIAYLHPNSIALYKSNTTHNLSTTNNSL